MSVSANVQWKGTRACVDWHCCGPADQRYEFHDCDVTFGRLTCPTCGKGWQLAHSVEIRPA